MDPFFSHFQNYLIAASLCCARMGIFIIFFPLFGSQVLTGVAKAAVIISLSLIVLLPTLSSVQTVASLPAWTLALILLKECFIGVIFALLAGMIFFAAESMGTLIDTQRGTGIGEVLNPGSGNMVSPIGLFLFQYVAVILIAGGGLLQILEMVYRSYVIWPLTDFFPQMSPQLVPYMLDYADNLMELALVFATPICLGMFLAQFGLGLMNRFAQQLNVFSVSMPLMSGVAFGILVLYVGVLYYLFSDQIGRLPLDWARLRDVLEAPR